MAMSATLKCITKEGSGPRLFHVIMIHLTDMIINGAEIDLR